MTALLAGWLTVVALAAGPGEADEAHYVDPLARAEVRASKTDIRSLADDLAVIRDALDGARDDLTACQRDGLYRDRSTTQLVADVEYRRSGGARKHKLLQSTGSLDLDHCVLSVLDRLEVRLRFRMPVCVEVDLPQPPDEDDELTPLWHEVNRFELDNGLVVMHLPRPGRDARLRLVIGAGSMDEGEGEYGIAHFVEHMVFRGSEEAGDMVFQLDGGDAAAHGNAYTSHDATVYVIQSTEDEPTDVQLGLIRQWLSGGVGFEGEVAEIERKVVLEEWRRRAARSEIWADWWAIDDGDPRWSENWVIGTEESLENFEMSAAEAFYHRFYRPDNATLIIVGGWERGEMERRVRDALEGVARPDTPPPQRDLSFQWPEEDRYAVVAAPGQELSVRVNVFTPQLPRPTHAYARQHLLDVLVDYLVYDHFVRAGWQLDRIWRVGVQSGWVAPMARRAWLEVDSDDPTVTPLMLAREVELELRRLDLHGFDRRALDAGRRWFESGLDERELLASRVNPDLHAEELVRVARFGEFATGAQYEDEMFRAWLPRITLDEVNARYRERFAGAGRMTLLSGDPLEHALPAAEALEALAVAVWSSKPEALRLEGDEVADLVSQQVVELPRLDGELAVVASRRAVPHSRYTSFTLDNGAQAHVVADTNLGRRVRLTLHGPGLGVLDEQGRVDAQVAELLAEVGGLAGMDGRTFARWRSEHRVTLRVRLGPRRSEVEVTGPLELLPQLVAVARRVVEHDGTPDPEAMSEAVARRLVWARTGPGALDAARRQALGGGVPLPDDAVERIDVERAEAALERAFADPSRVRLVMLGWLWEREEWEDAAIALFSGLGSPREADAEPVPLGTIDAVAWPAREGVARRVVAGADPAARVQVLLRSSLGEDVESLRLKLRPLELLLREHLYSLRDQHGLFYTVAVRSEVSRQGGGDVRVIVDFQCDPARVDDARTLVRQALASFPAALEPSSVEAAVKRRRSVGLWWWVDGIEDAAIAGEPWSAPTTLRKRLDELELDRERLVRVAKTRVSGAAPVEIILVPASAPAADPPPAPPPDPGP